MTNPVGSPIWYELMTTDPDGAKSFYDAVIGWTIEAQPAGEMDYRMITRSDGGNAGGVMRLTPHMTEGGAKPMWAVYLSVEDVDAEVAAITAEGGHSLMPAADMPGVGRIAMVADPQGVKFYVMKPSPPSGQADTVSAVFAATGTEHVSWNELASPDLAASKAFYARHFGFEFNNTMPMGPIGDYCFIDHHGQTLGAIRQRHDERLPLQWLFYFGVPSVAAATAAVESGGGAVVVDPHQVPGGAWIIIAKDPQGAYFGVVGPQGD